MDYDKQIRVDVKYLKFIILSHIPYDVPTKYHIEHDITDVEFKLPEGQEKYCKIVFTFGDSS